LTTAPGGRKSCYATDIINQLLQNTGTDVLCLTETWHEDSNATCIRRLRSQGWQVIERAIPIPPGTATDSRHFINHGSVALLAATVIKVERLKPAVEPTSFEHMLISCRRKACLVYLPCFTDLGLHQSRSHSSTSLNHCLPFCQLYRHRVPLPVTSISVWTGRKICHVNSSLLCLRRLGCSSMSTSQPTTAVEYWML